MLDFLLSLSAKAKEKLAKTPLPANPNKSVMYADQVVSEEDVSVGFLFTEMLPSRHLACDSSKT